MAARESLTQVGTAVSRHRWLVTTGLALALTVALVGLAGGWARSAPQDTVRVAPGTEVNADPFVVRLDRAEATYEVAGRVADKSRAFVVVEGMLRLDVSEAVSSSTMFDAVTVELVGYDPYGEPTDAPEPSVSVAGDGSALLGLGPGLTYEVLLSYEVDADAVPDELTLTLNRHVLRPSSLDETLGWRDPEPAARVTLDVAPLPAERPEPEGF